MTAITRVPLCSVKYCPAKNDPDWHRCWICQSEAIDHHHVENRGSGGSKRDIPVVALCRNCHERITLRDWGNKVLDGVYTAWDLHGNILIRRALNGATSEESEGSGSGSPTDPERNLRSPLVVAPQGADAGASERATLPPHGQVESSTPATTSPSVQSCVYVGQVTIDGIVQACVRAFACVQNGVYRCRGALVCAQHHSEWHSSGPSSPPVTFLDNGLDFEPEITFDEWAIIAAQVRNSWVGRQWRIGDLVNAGERFRERAEQVWDELGVAPETLFNYANVCRAYTLDDRSALKSLPFSFFQAVYRVPERLLWLDLAQQRGWSRAELREAVFGTTSRPKRFTIAEILGALDDRCEPCDGCSLFRELLNSLEGDDMKLKHGFEPHCTDGHI